MTVGLSFFAIFLSLQNFDFLAGFRDPRSGGFWYFCVTADLRVFGKFCELGPASLGHFYKTADLSIFGIVVRPRTCKFLAYFVTVELSFFCSLCNHGSASLWDFSKLLT